MVGNFYLTHEPSLEGKDNVTLDNDVIYVERSDMLRQYPGEFLTNELDLEKKSNPLWVKVKK